jgi:hypothetical protein
MPVILLYLIPLNERGAKQQRVLRHTMTSGKASLPMTGTRAEIVLKILFQGKLWSIHGSDPKV